MKTHISRREAIVAKCKECCDGESRVSACDHKKCVFYIYRTGKGKQDPVARQKAIRADCLDCMGDYKQVRDCDEFYCPLHLYRLGRIDKTSPQYEGE